MSKFKRGNLSETIVINYLLRLGFSFVDRNFKTSYGEVDLIMYKSGFYFFIEVKSSFSKFLVNPYIKLSDAKLARVYDTAMIWLQENNINHENFYFRYFFIWFNKDCIEYLQLKEI